MNVLLINFFLFHFAISTSSFEVQIIDNMQEFPTVGEVFKIPHGSDYLVCVSSDKLKSYSNIQASIDELMKEYTSCRGFRLDDHVLQFCYNQPSIYDHNINLGSNITVKEQNDRIVYSSSGGNKCVHGNQTSHYSFEADLICDTSLPKGKMECPSFWLKDDCTVQTVLKISDICKHPIYNSKGVYNIKCINRKIFEKHFNKLED